MVMCSEPAIRAPLRGWLGPYSARVAIRPGISISAMASSLRPQPARLMSLTMKSEKLLAGAADMNGKSLGFEKVPIAAGPGQGKEHIKKYAYADAGPEMAAFFSSVPAFNRTAVEFC